MLLSPSLSSRLSLHARHVLKEARDIARYTKSESIEPRHLILALMLEDGSLGSLLLENLGLKKDALGKLCLKKTSPRSRKQSSPTPTLAPSTQTIITQAFSVASTHHYPYVGTEHLASAFFRTTDPFLETLVQSFDISDQKISTTLESHLHFEQFPHMARLFETGDFATADNKGGSATPFLDQYAIDLAETAKTHPVVLVGREEELERLIQILGRREKRNPLLIGDPGVGKTALVTALATLITEGQAGPLLNGKRIMGLDLALLVAGTSFRGEFETRVKELLKEVKQAGNIILFIDEIHTLVGTGNTQGGLDAANILKPSLSRGEIQCIGATTLSEYKRHIEKDSALERRFQTVLLREPTPEEALAILEKAAPLYETHHQVTLPRPVLELAVTSSVRFLHDRFLPDKAFDLIDEASALVRRRGDLSPPRSPLEKLEREYLRLKQEKMRLIQASAYDEALVFEERLAQLETSIRSTHAISSHKKHRGHSRGEVTQADLLTVLSRMTHIPLERLMDKEPREKLRRLNTALDQAFIGQEKVKRAVVELLTRTLAGIRNPDRPIGSLLLLGPTGVGKTHLAELLAQEFFGEGESLIRLDMSEFMERHSIAQILGAPAGYVGYGEGGKLTEAVRRRPYSVILFDEIEKAHPDVANLLLQILDKGRLTDAEGRSVSFKHTLVILTGNIGTHLHPHGGSLIGFDHDTQGKISSERHAAEETEIRRELRETLRPELLSRLDHVLVFNRLEKEALEKIAHRELKLLAERLKERGVTLRFPRAVARYIAEKTQGAPEGARAIKQYLTEHVELILSRALLATPRPRQLTLTVNHGQLALRPAR